ALTADGLGGYGHRTRERPARPESMRGLECTVAITQQHADNAIGATAIGRALVGNHQVRLAIAVYIRNAERIGIISARWITHSGLKASVSILQEHANGPVCAIVAADTLIGTQQVRPDIPTH